MTDKNKPHYLVIDQGGHSSRAIVFTEEGDIYAEASMAIETYREGSDRVEHAADGLMHSIHHSIKESTNDIDPNSIDSVGLACQRSSMVCWDKVSGKALSPVLSWQDRRAGERLNKMSTHASAIHANTGLFLSPHYGASKMRWCLDNLAEVKAARENGRLVMGPLSSYILFKLLNEQPLVVDPVCASRTLLWNLDTRDWDPTLLELFDIPIECLPRCVPNQYEFGNMDIGSCAIPLTISTGDQPAALFMSGAPDADTIYINIGTGAFLQRMHNKKALITPTLLSSVIWQSKTDINYVLEGTVNGAGSALQEISDADGINQADMHHRLSVGLLAELTPPLFLNGVSGVGSPYWLPDFKSRFIGEGNTTEKLVAVVESILFLIQANLDEMQIYVGAPRQIIVSGGLSALNGLCLRLASLSGLTVKRTENQEATARGLAYLLSKSTKFKDTAYSLFEPKANRELERRYELWQKNMRSD